MPILFSEAYNLQGEIVRIANAKRGEKYICLDCGEPLFPKLRGIERAPHFAHYVANEKCSPIRWLHNALRDQLFRRIKEDRDIAIITSDGKKIYISEWEICEKEVKQYGFVPDIYVVVNGVEYFIEICVTHPCSEEKIALGKRIIELYTDDQRCKEELEKGDIVCDAKYYSVKFHNFQNNKPKTETREAISFPISTPFLTHDYIPGTGFRRPVIEEPKTLSDHESDYHSIPSHVTPKREYSPETELQSPPPFIYHYVLFPDGSEELLYVGVERSMLRAKPDAQLELGIGIADGAFAKEVGRRYAADRGLLPKETLSSIERCLDMMAIKKYLGFSEIL